MRALLVFFAFFLPLATLLWWLSDPDAVTAELPAGTDPARGQAVLSGKDFADETGATPFAGKVRELRDIAIRLSREGRIRFYFHVQELARADGTPQMEGVTCAVFGGPKDDTPRRDAPERDEPGRSAPDEGGEHVPLKLTLEADALAGDLPALVRKGTTTAKTARLLGRVVVRDAGGREIAQLDGAQLDLTNRRAASNGTVVFRMPDKELEVRGQGLDADVEFGRVRIRAAVRATVRTARGPALLTTNGSVTVTRDEDAGILVMSIEDGAKLEHPLGTATCRRLTARLVRSAGAERSGRSAGRGRTGNYQLDRIVLEGNVRFDLDPLRTRGVEFLSLSRVTFEGDHRISCKGPLHAVRRGALPVLGLGERVVDVRAGRATVLLRRGTAAKPGGVTLEELRFEGGLGATDRNGGGTLRARTLTFVAASGDIDLAGAVAVTTPDALVQADRIEVRGSPARGGGKDVFDIVVHGARRLEHVADGRLGALGEGTRGRLRLSARGPIRAHIEPGLKVLRAEHDVHAFVEEDSTFRAQAMVVEIRQGKLARFTADGDVVLRLRDRMFRGQKIVHEPSGTRAFGAPATLSAGKNTTLRARSFHLDSNRRFVAEGDVFVRARPKETAKRVTDAPSGFWEFSCARAEGVLPKKSGALPEQVTALGPVRATGPAGETLQADRAELAGQVLTLTGKPARLGRGSGAFIEAQHLEAKLTDGDVSEVRTVGEAVLAMNSAKGDFARWVMALRGTARFTANALEIPGGVTVSGYGKDGKLLLTVLAGRARIELERLDEKAPPRAPSAPASPRWRARRLVADRGVVITSRGKRATKVEARRLVYEAGRELVDVFGRVKVSAKGWPAQVRFKHVVFLVKKDGIDLKRASDIDIRRPK